MHDEGSLSKFECLVLVASAQMEDAGDWTCVISFRTSDGFKSISKSVGIKIKGSYCYDYTGELFKWPASCSQQPPDAISIDIGGILTTTDLGMSRGTSASIDSLDGILNKLADVMAIDSNQNDEQEQFSGDSSDSVSFEQPSKQPAYEQSGGKQ